MPTYVYRREDGTTFEIQQRITEDALTVDPETGQKVTRVITGSAGLVFKGEGFYLTDYVRNGNDKKSGAKKEAASSESGSAKKTDTASTSESKSSTSDTTSSSSGSTSKD